MDYLAQARNRDKRAIARLISLIENQNDGYIDLYESLFKGGGNARIIGVTGPPGAGKSTLVDRLALELSNKGMKIGILAIDPTSSFSGGALLGDRIRMSEVSKQENVYIRSMATRGSLGGVARATLSAIRVLDYAGFDYIFIETVGVGQSEIDISLISDLVMMLAVPGLGDEIQAIKAGVMEIADVIVLNKCDLAGSYVALTQLEKALELCKKDVKVLKVSSVRNEGIVELADFIDKTHEVMKKNGVIGSRRNKVYVHELSETLKDVLLNRVQKVIDDGLLVNKYVEQMKNKKIDPFKACNEILSDFKIGG